MQESAEPSQPLLTTPRSMMIFLRPRGLLLWESWGIHPGDFVSFRASHARLSSSSLLHPKEELVFFLFATDMPLPGRRGVTTLARNAEMPIYVQHLVVGSWDREGPWNRKCVPEIDHGGTALGESHEGFHSLLPSLCGIITCLGLCKCG
jgi:hypothetical protein